MSEMDDVIGLRERLGLIFSRKDMHLLSIGESLSLLWRIPLLVFGEIIFYVLEKYDPEWIDPLDPYWRMDG